MGASHIHLAAPFGWDSPTMNLYLRVFRSFIEDGSASMTSQADDKLDFVYSTAGISWSRDTANIFQVQNHHHFPSL
jgi:hypothetical protein